MPVNEDVDEKTVNEDVDEKTVNEDVDEKIYKYIVSHGGEISVNNAVEHLDISREQLMASIDRLRKTGRLD